MDENLARELRRMSVLQTRAVAVRYGRTHPAQRRARQLVVLRGGQPPAWALAHDDAERPVLLSA